ncbi:MAG: nucleoside:proton symporter [Bdellovibrionales bacterium]|nr:nucleoside:proton symporter [Bdellovibrionales bacterium]
MIYLQSSLGMMTFIGMTYLLSENRKSIAWKKVFIGFLIGLLVVVILTKIPFVASFFLWFNKGVSVIDSVTQRASAFVFGYLGGGETPFENVRPQHSFIIAFRVLPLILVVTVLSNILYYLKVLPFLINLFSKIISRFLGLSGPLSFGAAATIFLGTIESPLIIKPYLRKLSRGELFALISCSMATVAGSVMILYAKTLSTVLPNALGHLMIASIMSVPLALSFSLIMIPLENIASKEPEETFSSVTHTYSGFFDALVTGIQEGLNMVLQITATLIVLFALVYLFNEILGLFPGNLSLELIFGYVFRPIVWLIGNPWEQSQAAGNLMGIKVILNEFVAYLAFPEESKNFSPISSLIMTYALCGFANFGSVGIIVGVLSSILPERKVEISELALKSLLVGNLATLTTGLFIGWVS